jgi:hypothetical protein
MLLKYLALLDWLYSPLAPPGEHGGQKQQEYYRGDGLSDRVTLAELRRMWCHHSSGRAVPDWRAARGRSKLRKTVEERLGAVPGWRKCT